MSDTAFHWLMGGIFGAAVSGAVALAWVVVKTEPARRQAYMTDCTARGFTPPQCQLLYRQKMDSDDAMAMGAVGIALGAAGAARR